MVTLLCPVCGEPLAKSEKTYVCPRNHSFDLAKSGYVNLLLNSSQGHHGDDKLMVRARKEFLDTGYYDSLSAEIAAACAQYAPQHAVVVDAGCGEGKYTLDVLSALHRAGKTADMVGIDISKDALSYAAKRSKEFILAVASSSHMPLPDHCADLLLNIFSPYVPEEFHRILKRGGKLLRVYPLEDHLWELKQLIYDRPYKNPPTPLETSGFRILETRTVSYPIHLPCVQDIMALFRMTPYYYKTGRADQQKASSAAELTVSLSFGITIYETTS